MKGYDPVNAMNSMRFVWLITSLTCCTTLSAQGNRTIIPEPTRWTAQPTAIVAAPHSTPVAETATSTPLSDTGSASAVAPSAAAFPTLSTLSAGDGKLTPKKTEKGSFSGPAVTVTSSLAVVLGLFAAMIWISRRFGPSRSINQGVLPKEVFESLGSTSIDARTKVTLLRCGNRILVVAQTATGIKPLSEITDPEEVRRLTATCLGDASRSFDTTLRSIEKEPAQPGFVDEPTPSATPRKRSRLFASA